MTYYKELTHMITKAEKFHKLSSASWSPSTAYWCSSHPSLNADSQQMLYMPSPTRSSPDVSPSPRPTEH